MDNCETEFTEHGNKKRKFDSDHLEMLKKKLHDRYSEIEQSRSTIMRLKSGPLHSTHNKSKLEKIRDQMVKDRRAVTKETNALYDEQKIPQIKPKMKIPVISENESSKFQKRMKPNWNTKLKKLSKLRKLK